MTSAPKIAACRILALVVLATFGCASAYTPRPSHRISFIESGGALKLTRDSQSFGIWDVDQAVASNPRAESEARTYIHRSTAGLVLDVAGLGMVLTGASLGRPSTTRRDVGTGLVLGGLVTLTAALVLLATGASHFYDAVNIYDDGVPPDDIR
ncbi:MAG TPA: hypothetical protein VFG23_15135 [Polyangia bacterium]|nr:hypothetical protein [Polyangia bacterium]